MKDVLKQAIKTYDKIAKIYSDYTYNKIQQYQLTKFISLLQGKRILDAGSGSGRDVEYFLEEGYEPIGIDISEGMLKESRRRVPGAKFRKMDIRKLSFKENSFEGIWSMSGLSHIPKKEIPELLNKFNKILTNNGILYLALKEGKTEKEIKNSLYDNESRIFIRYVEEELIDKLEAAGFKIIRSEVNKAEDSDWLEILSKKDSK